MRFPIPRRLRPAIGACMSLAAVSAVALGVLPQQQGTVDLLTQANVTLSGAAAGDTSGFSVASAGDVNGDGFADVVVGAFDADPRGRTDAGSSYVVYGQASPRDIDLASLGSAGFRIDGAAPGDLSGYAVASAGDINGDGRADVIVGAPWADPGAPARTRAGTSYVIYGQALHADVDLASLGSSGFRIDGALASDQSGTSVASAGDMNGDGLADVMVGAPNASPRARSGAGSTYAIYGHVAPSNVDLGSLGSRGFRIDGAAGGDHSGSSVAPAGDVNGDSRPDIIVGAPDASPGSPSRTGAGSSYVIYGAPTRTSVDLGSVSFPLIGFRIDGAEGGDNSGFSVSSAGDMNGDGRADVIVGAPFASPSSRNHAGSSYVIYGQPIQAFVDLAAPLGRGAFQIDGAASDDGAGVSVASAGDVNGDGRADVIIGAYRASPLARTNAGSSYVIYGESAQMSVDLAMPLGSGAITIDGATAGDFSGRSVAAAGDVNGDGRSDLIVGAREASPSSRTGAGSSYVLYGFGAPSVSYPAALAGTVGTPMASATPVVGRTGTAAFAVSPALPAGLAINTATGVISGTPTSASTGTYTVTMTDLSGTASTAVTATVAVAPAPAHGPTAASGTSPPGVLPAAVSCSGAMCTTRGTVPAGVTRVTQSATAIGKRGPWTVTTTKKASCSMRAARGGTTSPRAYSCAVRLRTGRWTIRTSAYAGSVLVARASTRVRVKVPRGSVTG